jgi:predicted GNAT family acetyltransferase
MNEVQIKFGNHGEGEFFIEENGERIAFLVFRIHGPILTAIHTEVLPSGSGKGLAAKLVAAMVDHARAHALKIVPACPYVKTVFERHPERYADVWEKAS